jgi:hypothetical protein
MQFSEDLLAGQGILNVLDGVCNKRTAQSIRRHMADLQVRQCEQNLKALQQDVRDLDNDLLETDNCIEQLRYLAQQHTMFGSTGDDPAGVASRVHSGRLHDSGSANFSAESVSSAESSCEVLNS